MTDSVSNPYRPPATESDPPAPSQTRLSRLLWEAVRATVTIIGIMVGWALTGYGLLDDSLTKTVLGILVIGFSAMVSWKNRR